ncbi:unnamed protein product, partial [Didymodactylos carnosus]
VVDLLDKSLTSNVQANDYYQALLRTLWRYPLIKYGLNDLCKQSNQCKNTKKDIKKYTNIISNKQFQKNINSLIDCYTGIDLCQKSDNWNIWSGWSTCSTSCGMGISYSIEIEFLAE